MSVFQKVPKKLASDFRKNILIEKGYFKYERFETENPLLVFGYNAKQNHWKGRRLCRSGYRDHTAPDLVGRIVGWKDCVQGRKPYMMTTDTEPMWQEFLPEMEKRKRPVQRNGTGSADLCCQGAESERWWKNPGCDKRDPVRVVKNKGNEDPDRQYFDWNSSLIRRIRKMNCSCSG